METLRYLITGFPGAFVECHRWLVRISRGLWPFLLMPGHPAWEEIRYLRQLTGPEGQ